MVNHGRSGKKKNKCERRNPLTKMKHKHKKQREKQAAIEAMERAEKLQRDEQRRNMELERQMAPSNEKKTGLSRGERIFGRFKQSSIYRAERQKRPVYSDTVPTSPEPTKERARSTEEVGNNRLKELDGFYDESLLDMKGSTSLGTGSFGSVVSARDCETGEGLAVKHIICYKDSGDEEREWMERCIAETVVPKLLHRTYPTRVVKSLGGFFSVQDTPPKTVKGTKQPRRNRTVCTIVLERCIGTLEQWLTYNEKFYGPVNPIPLHMRLSIVFHLASAVEVVQKRCSMSHSDLKLNNVLIDPRGNVVLSDFGCVCRLSGKTHHQWLIPEADRKDKVREYNPRYYHATELSRTKFVTPHADHHAMVLISLAVLCGRRSSIVKQAVKQRQVVVESSPGRPLPESVAGVQAAFKTFFKLAGQVIGVETQLILNLDKFIHQCRDAMGGLPDRGVPIMCWSASMATAAAVAGRSRPLA